MEQHVPPKHRLTSNGLHGVISQKRELFNSSLYTGPTLNIPIFSLLFASHLALNTLILHVHWIYEHKLAKWEHNKKTNNSVGELFRRFWSGRFVIAWKLRGWTVQWTSLCPMYSHKLCHYKTTNVNKCHSPRLGEMLLGTDGSGAFPVVPPPMLLLALLHVLISVNGDNATSELCFCCCCIHFCGATILE